MALAHGNPNKVEAAYQRSDLEAKRRVMMTDWANVVTGVDATAMPMPLRIVA